jgi:hypothetical protein
MLCQLYVDALRRTSSASNDLTPGGMLHHEYPLFSSLWILPEGISYGAVIEYHSNDILCSASACSNRLSTNRRNGPKAMLTNFSPLPPLPCKHKILTVFLVSVFALESCMSFDEPDLLRFKVLCMRYLFVDEFLWFEEKACCPI